MRRLMLLCFAALAITAVGGFTAAVASAENTLPSILALTEGEIETKGSKSGAEVAKFNAGFVNIKAEFLLVELFAKTKMTSLGLAKILFEKSSCSLGQGTASTVGDAAGTVLIDNAEWHLVLVGTKYYLLILIPATKVLCSGGLMFTVQGSVLNELGATTGEVSTFKSKTECEKAGSAKAKFKSFTSDTGTGTAKLEANGGLGFEEVCEEVAGELETKSTQAYELMEP